MDWENKFGLIICLQLNDLYSLENIFALEVSATTVLNNNISNLDVFFPPVFVFFLRNVK